jgi:hypothetical protein
VTDYVQALREAAADYRREVDRAKEIRKQADEVQRRASDQLAEVMRSAFTEGKLRKAAIIRASDHVWSRTWVDRALDADNEPSGD